MLMPGSWFLVRGQVFVRSSSHVLAKCYNKGITHRQPCRHRTPVSDYTRLGYIWESVVIAHPFRQVFKKRGIQSTLLQPRETPLHILKSETPRGIFVAVFLDGVITV